MTVEQPEYQDNDSEQNPELTSFIEELRTNKEQILAQVDTFLHRPNKTKEDIALAIYLDVVLKSEVFEIDPFASRRPGDQEVQEHRKAIAFIAMAYVAEEWLKSHSDSSAAQLLKEQSIFTSKEANIAFLCEIWPSILNKL